MHLKKITSLFLAVFILFSSLGLAFNVHYCHDEIDSISLNFKAEEPCEESEASCCSAEENHKKCCSEKTIKVDKKTDNVLVQSLHFELPVFVVSTHTLKFDLDQAIISIKRSHLIENYCESNSPPFYKLYCQLVFYA